MTLERIKPANASSMDTEYCLEGEGGKACGNVPANAHPVWTIPARSPQDSRSVTLSTAELLGLRFPTLTSPGRWTPAVLVPSILVDESFFKKTLVLRNADGEEASIKIKPGHQPGTTEPLFPSLTPPRSEAARRSEKLFERARELAKKATAVDEGLARYRRVITLTHHEMGYEIRLIVFFKKEHIVKAALEIPYGPPTVRFSYYFDKNTLFVSRRVVLGMANDEGKVVPEIMTTFYDERGAFWQQDADRDPSKPEPPGRLPILEAIRKALAGPDFRIPAALL